MMSRVFVRVSYLYCREGSDDGRRSESMCDHGEVCEVALNGGIQHVRRASVAQGGAVLAQKVHQLLGHKTGKK